MAEPSLRTLGPNDAFALDTHLLRHWATSLLIRANFRGGGLSDEGELNQGSYAALFDGATMVGLAVHYRDGSLMLQAPRAVGQVMRAALADSDRIVEKIIGPWSQATVAANALGQTAKEPYAGKPESLAALDMGKLLADAVKRPDARARLATEADLPTLTPWRASYASDLLGDTNPPSADSLNGTRFALGEELAREALFVVETAPPAPRLVAMASLEAVTSDSVQVGAVWSPPAFKDKVYAPLAALGAVLRGRELGAKRAVLLSNKTDVKAQAAIRTMGFVAMDEFGVLHAPLNFG